jgi:hypothetical protein
VIAVLSKKKKGTFYFFGFLGLPRGEKQKGGKAKGDILLIWFFGPASWLKGGFQAKFFGGGCLPLSITKGSATGKTVP